MPAVCEKLLRDLGSATVYDALGQLTQKTDALNRISAMTYDGYRNLTSVTVNGQTIRYTYDALCRMIGKLYAGTGQTATYAYDGLGNLTYADNAVAQCKWTYNECGMLLTYNVLFQGRQRFKNDHLQI